MPRGVPNPNKEPKAPVEMTRVWYLAHPASACDTPSTIPTQRVSKGWIKHVESPHDDGDKIRVYAAKEAGRSNYTLSVWGESVHEFFEVIRAAQIERCEKDFEKYSALLSDLADEKTAWEELPAKD